MNKIDIGKILVFLLFLNLFHELEKKIYYIPLWHNELCYDASGKDIIVKCIPELDDNITIDNENNIYITIHDAISKILKHTKITFELSAK